MERMTELIELLNKAVYAYEVQNIEIMPNYQYDRLYDELTALEQSTGIVLSNSPTQKVGYEVVDGLEKVRHEVPMLSLDKTKSVEKLKSFLGDRDGLLLWKLDGLTIVLRYNGGKLEQAITRGNGEIGEDVTHNAKVFKNIPLKINFNGDLMIRGEAVIRYSDFERINDEIDVGEKYKNPRNLCSGTVRQLNSEIASGRHVMFFAFSVVHADGADFDDLRANQLKWLTELGFGVVEYQKVTADTLEAAVADFEQRAASNDVASDGLVLSYDSLSYGDSLGSTSKFPRDSIAFKWEDEIRETTLLDVQWQTSRTGLINPVAVFEPVEIEGSTVNKASLHNVSIVKSLALGIGDTITVYKANMIIPQVADNLTRRDDLVIPAECPVCKGKTEIIRQREGEALYCVNPTCRAQRVRALTHFVSRDAMNIEGLSISTIEKLNMLGFLDEYTDIYTLSTHASDIQAMEGFGEKSYANLIRSIEKSKDVNLANFIYALGINHVGLSNAKLLCRFYNNDLEEMKNASIEELLQVEGFGEVIAQSLYDYFHNEKNLSLLDKAVGVLRIAMPEDMGRISGGLENMSFVVTGDLVHFKNRKELQGFIESKGGKVTGSVTGKTSYLVNNDKSSASSKNKKAAALGVPVIGEEEFMQMFGS